MRREEGGGRRAPLPLIVGFALFLLAMGYLVAASLTRRVAPAFAPSAAARVRTAGWERVGDTVTVDAADGESWRYVSLEQGRVLSPPDTAGWDLAVRRYHLMPRAGALDLGAAPFEALRAAPGAPGDTAVMQRWYRYSLLTHLLEPNGHVYAVRSAAGRTFKVQVVSYYCPGLRAGCMTLRYAPIASAP